MLLPAQTDTDGHWRTVAGPAPADAPSFGANGTAQVLVRPEELRIDDASAIRGTVTGRVFRGSHFLYTVQVDGTPVLVHGDMSQPHNIGATVGLQPRN